jgi:amino acid transporter
VPSEETSLVRPFAGSDMRSALRDPQSASSHSPADFIRGLGLWDAVAVVAGSMIGSGVFIVSADIARQVPAPGWLLLVWLLTGVMTIVALFILRRTEPAAARPYRAVGYPIVPALYIALAALIMLDLLVMKPRYTWPGLALVLSGVPVFYWWRRS